MNALVGIIVFAILMATAYGVVFSAVYPLIPISGEIVTLCAIFGVATCLTAMGRALAVQPNYP
jgi:hypothetical protein